MPREPARQPPLPFFFSIWDDRTYADGVYTTRRYRTDRHLQALCQELHARQCRRCAWCNRLDCAHRRCRCRRHLRLHWLAYGGLPAIAPGEPVLLCPRCLVHVRDDEADARDSC